ncbi:MAG: chorismate-binding protein [Burkholderiales bacterium]|nr:chorismate-binding protein [Burkholderiales bacterium]
MQYAIFEDTLNTEAQTSFMFLDLHQSICVNINDSLENVASTINQLQQQGLYIVTHVFYEANELLYPQLKAKSAVTSNENLINFYAFKHKIKFCSKDLASILLKHLNYSLTENNFSKIFNLLEFENDYAQYQQKFAKVQEFLSMGESYQLNLTLKTRLTSIINDDLLLYYLLSRAQKVSYAAFLPLPNENIISISPELFFKKTNDHIFTKPMKGTFALTSQLESEQHVYNFLQHDTKNLAENTIIIDLLRNDMCKISQPGSIHTQNLFNIEKYATLFQMTSEIHSKINPNINILQILQGLFPCGSITGAPKLRTMELISQIENRLRGTYCGGIGFIDPNNDMIFNVAIRTVTKHKNEAFYNFGVGGGITVYSKLKNEWNEIKVKTNFLHQFYQPDFCLIESMIIKQCKIDNYHLHLKRLFSSLDKLNFNIAHSVVQSSINQYLVTNREVISPNQTYQLNIKIAFDETIEIQHKIRHAQKNLLTIALCNQSIDSFHPLFSYCTDSQLTAGLYQNIYDQYESYSLDEIIFKNSNNIITESKNFNLIIKLNGLLYTSPSNQGLIIRFGCQQLIDANLIVLTPITYAMFSVADEYYLCDDFNGLIQCNYIGII